MTPALFIKPDGKVYLIVDCPEKEFWPEGTEKYEDNRRSLEKAKASAILVENQEHALGLMSPVEKLPHSIYSFKLMPELKYNIKVHCDEYHAHDKSTCLCWIKRT